MAHSMAAIKAFEGDFGSRMRHVREERGVSLRQIADATKISVSALEALERNDISRLPGGIFSRAFVRSYAAAIGIDPEQTVREFLSQFPHESVTAGSPHVLIDDGSAERRRLDLRAVMILCTLVLVAVAIIFWTLR
jgi:cytoskeleton protein RodZ